MRNFTLNGQVIAFDAASNEWRVYDSATQTFGATAAAPVAGTTFNTDLPAPTLVLNNQNQTPRNQQRTQGGQPTGEPTMSSFQAAMTAAAVAAVLLLCVFVYHNTGKANDTAAIDALKAQIAALKAPPAVNQPTNAGSIKAIEVEVVPLNAVKTNGHAHVLHAQQCAGNEGKTVKVRVDHPTIAGLKGWDFYTCPKKS